MLTHRISYLIVDSDTRIWYSNPKGVVEVIFSICLSHKS